MYIRIIILFVGLVNTYYCKGIHFIDITESIDSEQTNLPQTSSSIEEETTLNDSRRYWLVSGKLDDPPPLRNIENNEDDKDENLKSKISTLVDQTLHDSEVKIKFLQSIKDFHKDDAPYKAGFILSLIKKSKDVLNELFNVAIRHKDDWKALEQLKVFELIVHTNVDTTNLVRQLVEVHIQHMNATSTGDAKKRVVLLK